MEIQQREARKTMKREQSEASRRALALAHRSLSENPPAAVFEELPGFRLLREKQDEAVAVHDDFQRKRGEGLLLWLW